MVKTIVPNISSAIKDSLHPHVTREKQGTLLTETTGVSFVAALLLNNHFIPFKTSPWHSPLSNL